jgi:hypothetical protein
VIYGVMQTIENDICDQQSTFRPAWDRCWACLKENSKDPQVTQAMPELAPFLAQCGIDVKFATTTMLLRDGRQTIVEYIQDLQTTTPAPRNASTTSTSKLTTSTPPPPSRPSPEVPRDNADESKDWIAGAVLGPIAALGMILTGYWFLRERRKASKTFQAEESLDKPQLHSECIPIPEPFYEDPGMEFFMEMEGCNTFPHLAEKPANEGIGPEKPANEGIGPEKPANEPPAFEKPANEGSALEKPANEPAAFEKAEGEAPTLGIPRSQACGSGKPRRKPVATVADMARSASNSGSSSHPTESL